MFPLQKFCNIFVGESKILKALSVGSGSFTLSELPNENTISSIGFFNHEYRSDDKICFFNRYSRTARLRKLSFSRTYQSVDFRIDVYVESSLHIHT